MRVLNNDTNVWNKTKSIDRVVLYSLAAIYEFCNYRLVSWFGLLNILLQLCCWDILVKIVERRVCAEPVCYSYA